MAQEIEKTAPTVEEAVEAAVSELGVDEQGVVVQVVQEPSRGVLGIGSQPAVVRVRLKSTAPDPEELDDQADTAADFLEDLLERMHIEADVEPNFEDGTMYVDILGESEDDEDMALLIGRHGQTLEALHELTRVVVSRKLGERCRVMVDVEDYRKRQRDRLVSRARDLANQVARTGAERELEPMNAYERKLVHDAVAGIGGVQTVSRGEDPERRVVLTPASD